MIEVKKHLKRVLLSVLLSLCLIKANAQGYDITINIQGVPDTLFQIGYYWGGDKHVLQEASMINGVISLKVDKVLPTGMYFVRKHGFEFDFIIKESQFQLSLDKSDPYGSLQVTGSKENQIYKEFRQLQNQYTHGVKEVQRSLRKAENHLDTVEIYKSFEEQESNLISSINTLASANEGLFVASLIRLLVGPEPQTIDNYWEGVDFSDPNLLYTPWLYPKVKDYLTRVIRQNVNEVTKRIDEVLAQTMGNKQTFRYWTGEFLVYYQQAHGFEAIYLHIIKTYYLSGLADWVPQKSLEILKEDYEYMKANLIGNRAPELELINRVGLKVKPLEVLNSDYTILFFYDPTCSHCMEVSVLLNKEYEKWGVFDFELLSINVLPDQEKWSDFINTYQLVGTHMMNPLNDESLFKNYDIRSTPKVYVLDKDGYIIGRNMDVSQLTNFMEYLTRILK